jgi:hypothetical protein
MRRWVKRLGLTIATLLTMGIVLVVISTRLAYSRPTWYAVRPHRVPGAAPTEFDAAGDRADQKVVALLSWAAAAQARIAAMPAPRASAATPASRPGADDPPGENVTFTADEINAFVDKWLNSDPSALGGAVARFGSDPQIQFEQGRLILAATVPNSSIVISIYLQPAIDDQGKLSLPIVAVQSGRLPLPMSMFGGAKSSAAAKLRENLPAWQAAARIDPDGAANGQAVRATLALATLNLLGDRSADPIVFLPFDVRRPRQSIPVSIRAIEITDQTLSLTIDALNAEKRAALLNEIQSPVEP